MANTTAFDSTLIGSRDTKAGKPRFPWLSNAFNAYLRAREKEARLRVRTHLSELSDSHLKGIGLSAREIELLREGQLPRSEMGM